MSVIALDHQHDPPFDLEGLGPTGQRLIIQTGTLVLDFRGSPGGDWVRDRLVHPVVELPPNPLRGQVRAIASAAPASMMYAPSPASGPIASETRLWAEGDVFLGGTDAGQGFVTVSGHVSLPVVGSNTGSTMVPISAAGWAVDRTRAQQSANHIQLVVDLAVLGPSALLRLAYSIFVTILPRDLSVLATSGHGISVHGNGP